VNAAAMTNFRCRRTAESIPAAESGAGGSAAVRSSPGTSIAVGRNPVGARNGPRRSAREPGDRARFGAPRACYAAVPVLGGNTQFGRGKWHVYPFGMRSR
jgi:hypothetical protein